MACRSLAQRPHMMLQKTMYILLAHSLMLMRQVIMGHLPHMMPRTAMCILPIQSPQSPTEDKQRPIILI